MRMILALSGLMVVLAAASGAAQARTACELACLRQFSPFRCERMHLRPSQCQQNRQNCIFRCARLPR